jgi:fatty acid desaturase
MHHPENNLWKDKSSTLPYQRDSLLHFGRYFGRFITVGLFELTSYLWRHRRKRLVQRALLGEALFWSGALVLGRYFPAQTLTVFVAPVFIARFLMMAGNWGQHAFVDVDAPGNAYLNSITCIEVAYNDRCFNDGYHIAHHLYPRMHFTELPLEYERNRARYVEEKALVFRGIDFVGVWALLMVGAHRALAKRIVSMDGLSVEERVTLMRARLSPVFPPVKVLQVSPHEERAEPVSQALSA